MNSQFTAGDFWTFIEPNGEGTDIHGMLTFAQDQAQALLAASGHDLDSLLRSGEQRLQGVDPGSLVDVAHMVFCSVEPARLYLHRTGDGGSVDIAAAAVAEFMAKFMIMQAMAAGVDGAAVLLAAKETNRVRALRAKKTGATDSAWRTRALAIAVAERLANPQIPRAEILRRLRRRQGESGLSLPADDEPVEKFLKENGIGGLRSGKRQNPTGV